MKIGIRGITLIFMVSLFTGCASHPFVGTGRMKKGDTVSGYTLSIENVIPVMWYRYALTDETNVGFRVGIPAYGTGIDYSRLLFVKENKWDVLNLAWSVNPNYNFDLTYYKFHQWGAKADKPGFLLWWGIRGMYIPKGITDNSSSRIGFLLGMNPRSKIGFEIGYFHDFSSMPLASVFNPNWRWDDPENIDRYGNTPHIDPASGMPSEYSRLTGISFQVFFNLNSTSKPDTKPPSGN